MWLFLWDSQPSKIFVWDSEVSKVFVGSTQIRPSSKERATQWPAPDGFHVPLTTEWQAVRNIRIALGGW
jgi:hypothetical protein